MRHHHGLRFHEHTGYEYGAYMASRCCRCATNGGEGVPVWVAQHFQARPETAAGEPYLVSPSHPLEIALPRLLQPLWGRLVSVQTSGEEDPWRAFSVEDETPGRPATLMNLGNPSIRLNNYGESWRSGVLFLSKQVQSLASLTCEQRLSSRLLL